MSCELNLKLNDYVRIRTAASNLERLIMEQVQVTFNVQDVEPGWTCVSFIKPPRLAKSRTHALVTFLESWRQNHPTRRVGKIEFVEDGDIVRCLNIFWSVFGQVETESMLDEFKVDEELENMYGLEYAEALMHDALAVAANNARGMGKILMISKRLIAIIILRHRRIAFLTTYDKFISVMDEDFVSRFAKSFEHWRRQETNDYLCIGLPEDFEWNI